jgi:tetratricopeptide (TPR) repeat protein
MEPNDAEIQANLGIALMADGETDRAINAYERAVRLDSDVANFHCVLSKALLNSKRPISEAIEEAQTAIRLDPELAEAHHNLGVALARSGQVPAAAKEFQETIRLDPQHADAYANLAKAYAVLGRAEDVVTTATAAIALAKSSGNQEAAGQIEAWLANYRANPPKRSATH